MPARRGPARDDRGGARAGPAPHAISAVEEIEAAEDAFTDLASAYLRCGADALAVTGAHRDDVQAGVARAVELAKLYGRPVLGVCLAEEGASGWDQDGTPLGVVSRDGRLARRRLRRGHHPRRRERSLGNRPAAGGRELTAVRAAMLGAGVMGRNIARVLASAGTEVVLFSRSAATLRSARRHWGISVPGAHASSTSASSRTRSPAPIWCSSRSPSPCRVKLAVLREVEGAVADDTVIATNTSSLSLDQLAGALRAARAVSRLALVQPRPPHPARGGRPVGVHPSRGGAVVGGDARGHGQAAAGAGGRDRRASWPTGFSTRLIREALALVEAGAATPAQIDAVITDCLGPRWAVIGPMRSSDLAGIPTAVSVAGELFPKLSNADTPPAVLTELLDRGRTGAAAGAGFYDYPDGAAVARERDRLLEAVLAALAEARSGG